jgi:peptidoglycan/xylan/chitin deacetylase (PgdA/CDA1 family)
MNLLSVAGLALVALFGSDRMALSQDCTGNSQAIGTKRTIVVAPTRQPRIGTEQYGSTLPLNDHEIVLSFDDGPLPEQTGRILDILAKECARAIFFVVGEMARGAPEFVRRVAREGHMIGTHTRTHPHLGKLPFADATAEIEGGIGSAISALGGPDHLTPFFRAPYFETTPQIERYVQERGLMLWGVDFDSDDWMEISPDEVVARALRGIEKKGRGILLLHDIQERTVVALPRLLSELKKRGYHIVQPVPPENRTTTEVVRADSLHANVKAPVTGLEQPRLSAQKRCAVPEAFGTSRVLIVDPAKSPRVGTVQFAQTLPLDDHELVLTFDDGPLPPFTERVLDTLASQCIRATFFVVGEMANNYPDLVRRLMDDGHTVGTLTQSHAELSKLSFDSAKKEIDSGIASVKSALGPSRSPAPFFRDPYLQTSQPLQAYLESQHIVLWSIDFQADDWQDISPDEVISRAVAEIEQKRKGILELYDIQERTAVALPKLLGELKQRGYRIVHVVPPEPVAAGVQTGEPN